MSASNQHQRLSWISTLRELTPVEKRGTWLFKRDDHYRPLGRYVNGGKLRQLLTLLRHGCSRGVITGASIHSPQNPIVACVARHLGIPAVAVVGGEVLTPELALTQEFGTRIVRVRSGRHSALKAAVSKLNQDLAYYPISHGMAPSGSDLHEFFDVQAFQTSNLPAHIDTLVITLGSGTSTIGLIEGLRRFRKHVGTIVTVSTAPTTLDALAKTLAQLGSESVRFWRSLNIVHLDLFRDPRFRYEHPTPFTLCGIDLHPRYEAKAFRHVLKNTNFGNSPKTLFWIVGSDFTRQTEDPSR